MSGSPLSVLGSGPTTDNRRPAIFVLVTLLFLAPRIALLFLRQPFFDELFTHWISAKSFAGILSALRFDSGPPLYYFVVHALGNPPVVGARLLSLACATVTFVLVYRRSPLAAALLAVYPPAVLMSVDARAYSMCAMFLAIGGPLGFVLAAYSHYYGVLFFPLLLLKRPRDFFIACALFAPGFWLAFHQPAEAMAWNSFPPLYALANLSFAGIYVEGLFASAPVWVVVVAMGLLVGALARRRADGGTAGGPPARRYLAVLIPIGLVLLSAAVGRSIYFPLRFESVIAAPLMLWIAETRWKPVVAALGLIGAYVVAAGIVDHAQRVPGDCTRAAREVRARVPAGVPVVASGYCYLETLMVLPAAGAFPAEQAQHPGWWQARPAEVLMHSTGSLPQRPFIWIGSQYAPELGAIRRGRRTAIVGHAGNVFVLQVY